MDFPRSLSTPALGDGVHYNRLPNSIGFTATINADALREFSRSWPGFGPTQGVRIIAQWDDLFNLDYGVELYGSDHETRPFLSELFDLTGMIALLTDCCDFGIAILPGNRTSMNEHRSARWSRVAEYCASASIAKSLEALENLALQGQRERR